jgi:uncharacterized protein YndB with AHSA1/START domain
MSMNKPITVDAFGTLTEPATLTIQRIMPGPIGRVWSYLTESNLRRQWLASGEMEMKAGSTFELTWRNSELTDPPGERPEGFGEEHRMQSRIIACDPPHKLAFVWGENGSVMITLEPQGSDVLLTLIHERLGDRSMKVMVGAGWHAHLDILVARVAGRETAEPFWNSWTKLKKHYEARVAA